MNSNSYTIGAELEFYLLSENYLQSKGGGVIADLSSGKFPQKHFDILPEFAAQVAAFCNDLSEFKIKTESGAGQLEVEFNPTSNPSELAELINKFKTLTAEVAVKHHLLANFAAKPLAGQCGSALHIHFCHDLFDPYGLVRGKGVMSQKVDPNNDFVKWAIGGCLARVRQDLELFVPSEASRERFEPFMNAPTKICWGRNNRSVAVRVPDSKPKRLEHRISGADADAGKVINAVISAALYGIENKIDPGEEIFGNAWEGKYEREMI